MKRNQMLNDKVVIITGGAGLLGRSFVHSVVKNGGIAVVADMNSAGMDALKSEIEKTARPDRIMCLKTDITSRDSIISMISQIYEKYSRIDALVNNAYPRNGNYGKKFEEVTYSDFCENLSMHVGGYFLMSQQVSEYFIKSGYGTIINMGSIYGIVAPRFSVYDNMAMTMPVEYAAIKSAIIHLTRYMAQYFKGRNIRVNSISPGGILNKQNEDFISRYNSYASIKGMLEPGDLQGTLLFLLSDMSAFINGQNIVVDDGWTL